MEVFNSIEQAAEQIIKITGGHIVLGIPLGLGKPNQLVNALFQTACADPSIKLDIYTALSLAKPAGKSDLEKRFLAPFVERVYGDYVELDYLKAMHRGELPENVTVYEFFFKPGGEINNPDAQQHYLSSNYTHAPRDINNRKFNVVAQMLACEDSAEGRRYSLACNAEIFLDLLPFIERRRASGEEILIVGQINNQLPFIENHAEIKSEHIDILVDDPATHTRLFSTPNMPVNMPEHFIGLNASALIRDGGTLQIGIGALGDAVASAVLLRDKDNVNYQQILREAGLLEYFSEEIAGIGGIDTFKEGLYGCSEMFTYGLLRLIKENVIRRRVKDEQGNEFIFHGGFFLGPSDFYLSLRDLPQDTRKKIDLLNISFVNHLYGDEVLKRRQRLHARFVNTAFTVTLLGSVVSDQLDDGRVLSGVGGQYNFVAQAHELEGARSILLVRATRTNNGEVSSNLVWNYGHTTVPRHLRDIVITEYGIADLRSKTDAEVIKAMLNICDSRFQESLLAQAKVAGKVEQDYVIPEVFCQNTPERLQKIYQQYRAKGYFSDFPLGSDFTEVEETLIKALSWLKANAKPSKLLQLAKQLHISEKEEKQFQLHLERMGLEEPVTLKERIYRQLLLAALTAIA